MVALTFYLFALTLLGSALMVVFSRNAVHSVLFLILAFFNGAALFVLLQAELLAMLLVVVYVGAVAVLFLFVVMMLDITPQKSRSFYTRQNLANLGTNFLRLCSYGIAFTLIFVGLTFLLSYGVALTFKMTPPILYYGVPVLFSKLLYDPTIPQNTWEVAALVTGISFSVSPLITNRLSGTTFFGTAKAFFRLLPMSLLVGVVLVIELVFVMNQWSVSSHAREVIASPTPPPDLMTNAEALGLIIYKDYVYAFQASGLILLVAMIGAIVLTLRQRKKIRRQDVGDQIARTREGAIELKKVPLREGV